MFNFMTPFGIMATTYRKAIQDEKLWGEYLSHWHYGNKAVAVAALKMHLGEVL
jgi:hypothetical protein